MGAYNTLTDSELLLRFNNGDKAAWEGIYLRYWAILYQHARKMLADNAKAQDLVHDIFTGLLVNLGTLQIKTPLSAYLYRSIRNGVINLYYKDANRHKYEASMKGYYERGSYVTDETIIENELRQRIEKAVSDLPDKMRQIFELSRNDERSYKEIAEATDVSEETVRTQIKRALKILRAKLNSLLYSLL